MFNRPMHEMKDNHFFRYLTNKMRNKISLTPKVRDLLADKSGSPILLSSSNDGVPIVA